MGAIRAMAALAAAVLVVTGSVWGQHPDEMAVVTFNIRYDNPDDPLTWEQRRSKVASTVGYFDILGFQEALVNQVDDLAEALPNHDHYGVGRDDGRVAGEHCPIFWNRARFDLLHAETKWLSATPDVPGSVGGTPPCRAQRPSLCSTTDKPVKSSVWSTRTFRTLERRRGLWPRACCRCSLQ